MTTTEFWHLIDLARHSSGGIEKMPQWLKAHLMEQTVDYITSFKEWFHEYSCQAYDGRLWLAAGLMLGLCSDDKFDDFRGWLIANGKHFFESVLENPDRLAELQRIDGDGGRPLLFKLLCAPDDAYREKTGGGDLWDLLPNLKKPTLLNPNIWDGDQSKLQVMFPMLWAKYRNGHL